MDGATSSAATTAATGATLGSIIPGVGTAIGAIGGALVGGLFGKSGANKSNFDSQMFAINQARYQQHLADTAHQREVKDLMAAGLNPLLSANKGATVPGTVSANFANPNEAMAKGIGKVNPLDPTILLGVEQLRANISKTHAETAVSEATAANLKEQNLYISAQTYESQARAAKIYAEISGKTFLEAGLTLFGNGFKYRYEGYNNQPYPDNVPKPAVKASSDSLSGQLTNSIIRGEHRF